METFSSTKQLLKALEDFAAVDDSNENSLRFFLNKWLPLFTDGWLGEWPVPPSDPGRTMLPAEQQEWLREVASRPRTDADRESLVDDLVSEQRSKFLDWHDRLRAAWRGNTDALVELLGLSAPRDPVVPSFRMRVVPDWQRSQFTYQPQNSFERAVYELLKNSRLAKVCANPDCPHPFFLASHVQRRFCSTDCADPSRLKSQREYWKRKGKQQRTSRLKAEPKRKGK